MKYGAIKDVADFRDYIALPSSNILKPSSDLSQWMPPITDQGQEGSCTGQTGVRILSWLYYKFTGKQLIFSSQFLYRAERLCEGDPEIDGGAQSRTMMAVMREIGVCLESTDPYKDSGWKDKTTYAMLKEASKFKLGAYHRAPTLDILKSILSSGYPLSIAIDVYQSFESDKVSNTGQVPVPNPSRERSLGGHEVTIYGHSDTSKVLLLHNSWGTSWGQSGRFTLPYDYWPFVMDSWTAHLGKAW